MNKYGLGVNYTAQKCEFGLFAPDVKKVSLVLYEDAGEYDEEGNVASHCGGRELPMKKTQDDIWRICVEEDLEQACYMYKLTDETGREQYARDPYAKAVTANGHRSVVLDLAKTDPEGFSQYKHVDNGSHTDAVVYELHVRDFSMDESVPFAHRGKFLAFTEKGLQTPGGHAAGIDSLKELGITHVQFQPIYDYAVVNELRVDEPGYQGQKFNWGYDPHNYNVPEGAYATDVIHPQARIKECKEMIMALHKAGIGVIMDVVFNHTFSIEDGPFGHIAPDYYYRKKPDGTYSDGAACGNEVATERKMVRAYIKDSLKYWVEEYGIDGFRFDLMGLIDVDTMQEITDELRSECKSDIILYGEPWQAGGSVLAEEKQTLKGAQKDRGFGIFNDNIRDALKGSTRGRDGAFVQGRKGFEKEIAEGVCGSIHSIASQPTEVVNYAGAHDDLNLWDKVITTLGLRTKEGFLNMEQGKLKRGNFQQSIAKATLHQGITSENVWENKAVRACVLANSIVLTAQGIAFIHAGDEILRSKYGDANSFISPDAINKLQWQDKDRFYPVFQYYQKLITLRKKHPAFRMADRKEIMQHLEILTQKNGLVSLRITEHANGDEWKNIFIVYNGNEASQQMTLPLNGTWELAIELGTEEKQQNNLAGEEITIAGTSMMIWYQK